MQNEVSEIGQHHKIETFERGTTVDDRPGFAARCKALNCNAITFGGFPSRAAARRALDGHAAPACVIDGDDVA